MGVFSSVKSVHVRRRWVAFGVVALLAVGGGVTTASLLLASTVNADCSSLERVSADEAAELARACDADVEVLAERSPWVTVVARPDGTSKVTIDAVPTRTDVNGAWESIDTDVSRTPQGVDVTPGAAAGSVRGFSAPVVQVPDDQPTLPEGVVGMLPVEAPAYAMWFNPGGNAGAELPLGVVERDGSWVKLTFPLPLPVPEIDGRFVTYQLSADVSLVVSVETDGSGFRPIIEVGSPAGAQWLRNALDEHRAEQGLPGAGWEIPYRVDASADLSLRDAGGAGFELVGVDGEVMFWAPPSYMWDSAADLASEGGVADRIEFPLPGDRTTEMPVTLIDVEGHRGVVLVAPDEHMLSAEDTVWPVRIDPTVAGRTPGEWAAIRTGGFTSPIYKWADTASRVGESMGLCSYSWTSACGTTFTSRLVWEFGGLGPWMTDLAGKDITSAKFSADPGQRGNCTSTRTDAYHVDLIQSSSPKWGDIGFTTYLSNVTAPQGDACSDGGVRREWDVLVAVKYHADHNRPEIAFGLKANNEGSSNGYKTYKNDARFEFTYNRPPHKPTSVKLASPVAPCASGAGRPVIASTTPTLSAVVNDPDLSSVQAHFQIVNPGTETEVWNSGTLAAKASGPTFTSTVASGKLASGKTYQYRVTARDDGNLWSGWSTAVCEFTVDTEKPAGPTVTPVRTGVAAVYERDVERGGVGLAGKFVISRGAATDVTKFAYSFDGTPPSVEVTPDASGAATLTYTPTAAGPVTLQVVSKDAAGNASPATAYAFDVATAREDGVWMLDEGSGSVAADSTGSTPSRDLAVVGAEWVDGPHDLFGSRPGDGALWFDGVDDQGTTGPVADTEASFVISAYVWLVAGKVGTGSFTAVSQDGISRSGFERGYIASCAGASGGCWSFRVPDTDAVGSATTTVTSPLPVAGDRWVHLVGAHDASAHTLRLWACDIGTPTDPGLGDPVKSETSRAAAPWTASGAFTLGRGLASGSAASWWPGVVDNVRVFSGQVVSEEKIRRMCHGAEARDFSAGADALDPTTTDGE